MKNIKKLIAAAAAVVLASTAGCSAPGALTIGSGTKTALTIDGYEIPAGIFIFNEIYAYNDAVSRIYSESGQYPTVKDMEKASIDSKDSVDWIQDKATEYCKDFVAAEKEFDKIGGKLTDEELNEIDESVEAALENKLLTENGIGEESIRKMVTNGYKIDHIFEHYFGIGAENGCTEDELKEYFVENTARIKSISVKLTDSEGKALGDDEKHKLENKIKEWVSAINSESSELDKMHKMDDIQKEYTEFAAQLTATGTVTTTTTTTTTTTAPASSNGTATTTTTNPYANERTVTKYTTTTAPIGEATVVTTEAETEAQKNEKKLNDMIFNDLKTNEAISYEYSDSLIYIILKGDIKVRMTDDDLWSEDIIDGTLQKRYGQDYKDMMESFSKTFSVDKNQRAYRRYDPFELDLEAGSDS